MTNRALVRKDPPKGKKGFSKNKGFTVIELMVVVAIVAIITSLAFPSYRTLIEKREVTSGAQQLSAFLSAAKMESIKRNEQIAIWRDVANQCVGYFSYNTDATTPRDNCDCTLMDAGADNACAIDEFNDGTAMSLRVLNSNVLNKPVNITAIELGGTDELVIFDPVRGMLVSDDTVAQPLQARLLSKEETYGLNVRLSATGRVTICSDQTQADYAVPGYDDCNG